MTQYIFFNLKSKSYLVLRELFQKFQKLEKFRVRNIIAAQIRNLPQSSDHFDQVFVLIAVFFRSIERVLENRHNFVEIDQRQF